MMKAIVYTRYGSPDVLELRELETPVPGDDDVLVKVHAATVATGDSEMRAFRFTPWLWMPLRIMMGVFRPRFRILGSDLAGVIVAVGKNVENLHAGDEVFATSTHFGAHAGYKCLAANGPIARKPVNMSLEEAASIPTGAYNALHFLRRADVQSGETVLINGAGGAIGVLAIQLARYFGAHVTAIDSTDKLDMLRAIGAQRVIDFTRTDFTTTGETYDVIFDVYGNSPYSRCVKMLQPGGRYLLGNPRLMPVLRGIWTSATSDKKIVFAFAAPCAEDLDFIRRRVENGDIKAVIDRVYRMEEFADAHRYVDTGQKKGNVIIRMVHDD